MKLKILWGVLLAFVMLSVPVNAYSMDFYTVGNTSANKLNLNMSSLKFNSGTTCEIRLSNYLSVNEANLDIEDYFYSPFLDFAGYSTLSGLSAFQCKNIGYVYANSPTGTGYYDAQNIVLQDGNYIVSKLRTHFECSTTGSNYIVLETKRLDRDDKGYYPYAMYYSTKGASATIYTLPQVIANYSGCQGLNMVAEFKPKVLKPTTPDYKCEIDTNNQGICAYVYPFNSSYSGFVNIFMNTTNNTFFCSQGAGGSSTKQINITLYNPAKGEIYSFGKYRGACDVGGASPFSQIFNETLQLEPNQLYFIVLYASSTNTGFAGNQVSIRPPMDLRVQIDNRIPNYQCGDYSECLNGTQFRSCVDQTGVFPDKIDVNSCWVYGVEDELLLGFENPGKIYDYLSCFPTVEWPGFFCPSKTYDLTAEVPKYWDFVSQTVNDSGTIKNGRHFAQLTSDVAHSGQRSLEMWSLPPKLDEPITINDGASPATCNFSTSSPTSNYAQTNNLTDVIASNAFTFPTPNAVFTWWDKRDLFPKNHYDLRGSGIELVCEPDYLYYGAYTAGTPTAGGKYRILINEINSTTNATIRFVYDAEYEANTSWVAHIVDLSGKNISGTSHYRVFIMSHLDEFESVGNHVYIDDMKIQDLSQALNESLCQNYCDPDVIGRKWICEHIIYEDGSSINEWSYFDDDYDCIVASGGSPDGGEYDPPNWIKDLLDDLGYNQSTIDASGMGFLLNFLSPFFIGIMIILGIGGFLELKVAQAGGSGHGLIFAFVFLIGTSALTLFGIFPAGWGILMVIIGGLGTVFVIMKGIFGGS